MTSALIRSRTAIRALNRRVNRLERLMEKMMPKATRTDVYAALDGERDYQDRKWGPAGEQQQLPAWVLFMEDYVARARREATNGHFADALENVRKATALGVACMEEHGAPPRVG